MLCLFCSNAFAKKNVIRSLFMSKAPFHNSDIEEAFEMTGELGLSFTSGNRDGNTFFGKLNASHDTKIWSSRYAANVLYKQNERNIDGERRRVTSAQKVFVSAQTDYKLEHPSNRLFVYGEFEDDRFNAYTYQAALAFGWTERLWADKYSEFRYSVGPGYAISKLKPNRPGKSQIGLIVRAALEYKKMLNENATFRQFLSTETDNDFSRSVSETSLAAKINGALAMKLSINMTHNESPNSVREPLDTQTSVTLVYQFF